MNFSAERTLVPVSSSFAQSLRTWYDCRPASGQNDSLKMSSGVFSATSSMFMPPALRP